MKVNETEETVSISRESVRNILREHLYMTKQCAGWLLLLVDLIKNRVERMFQPIIWHSIRAVQPKVLSRFITVDKT